jgi:hypothetical protein
VRIPLRQPPEISSAGGKNVAHALMRACALLRARGWCAGCVRVMHMRVRVVCVYGACE